MRDARIPSMRKKISRIGIVLGVVSIVIYISFGIYKVNATAYTFESEHYSMGEWVNYEGAFLETIDENTQGYSIRVNGAQIISYNEYIEFYGLDKNAKIEGLDTKSIIVLDVEARNVENDNGYIFLFETKLIPERKNEYFIMESDLWTESEEALTEGERNFALSLEKNSEYVTSLPYTINESGESYPQFQKAINDTRFELVLTNSPVRKVISIDI